MALGWDTAIVIAAIKLEIPIIAAVPFKGQESQWPTRSQQLYRQILKKIEKCGGEIVVISKGGYSAAKMLRRDEYIVDHSQIILALWDGNAKGGTAHTVSCAKEKNLKIVNAWSDWKK